jgi:predicted CXXCH cytochrome family protein
MRLGRFDLLVVLVVWGAAEMCAQPPAPVGLSLLANNGVIRPITFYDNPPRFIGEIDLVFTAPAQSLDDGIEPLKTFSGVSDLNWTGTKMVDEDWRATGNTFRRQRFYRNAAWMNAASRFNLVAVDAGGKRIGPEFKLEAGRDDLAGSGDMFVRRFIARQIANGCKSQTSCEGAEFSTQALVQLRVNKNPRKAAMLIPAAAAALELRWSQNPKAVYKVEIKHTQESGAPSAYGFEVGLDLPRPSNGKYFLPGDSITFRALFRDGRGRELFPDHQMPTYGQFVREQVPTGLGYYSSRIDSTVYYALKHREANILVALAGPLEKLHVPKSILNGERLLDPEAVTATVPADGFSGVFTGLPNFSISLGPPAAMEQPVTDWVTLTVPKDAQPGTYVAAIKSRRVFGGEALNRAGVALFQVSSAAATPFEPTTGHCDTCHQGATSFRNVLHGVEDRRACYGCHMGLSFEPDNALDFRVHSIHSRSRRFGADVQKCSVCHLKAPDGPARGLLVHAGF